MAVIHFCVSENFVPKIQVETSFHLDRGSLDLTTALKLAVDMGKNGPRPEVVICQGLRRTNITWEIIQDKISTNCVEFFYQDFIEYLMIPEDFGTLFMINSSSFDVPIDYEKIGVLNMYVQSLQQSDREKMLATLEKMVVVNNLILGKST